MARYERLLLTVILINIMGTAFGFYYYKYAFETHPPYLWIFLPDSPLATGLFAASLLLLYMNRHNNLLALVGSINTMKYGFWTLLVIIYFSDFFLEPSRRFFYYLMFLLHFMMIIQPALIIHKLDLNKSTLALALAWILLNDIMDYVFFLTPLYMFPFQKNDIMIIGGITTISSLAIITTLFYLQKYKKDFFRDSWRKILRTPL